MSSQARVIGSAAVLLLVAACTPSAYPYRAQTPPASAYHPYRSPAPLPPTTPAPSAPTTKTIEIISDPPGARIEVNQDYVGDAPITVTVPQQDNCFKDQTVIRAVPTQAGDYTQTKFFNGPIPNFRQGDPIPSRILFDMRLGPVAQPLDVNINPPQ
jgi:PEGA domain